MSPATGRSSDAAENEINRRDFVRGGVVAALGMVAAVGSVAHARRHQPVRDPVGPETTRALPAPKTIPEDETADVLVRMQAELRRAMAKPVEQRRWAMVIDTRKCVGCFACTVACMAENKLPPGVVYRPVVQEEFGQYPNVQLRFFPRPCMQCDQPPCVPVCPVNATWKRPDGVVAIDYDKCIGCRYCVAACPYGARTSDFGHFYTEGTPQRMPYETLPNHEYGKSWSRERHGSPMGNARKCQFCLHRLEEGELPQCVTTCIGRANYFGDANDPGSLVAEKLRAANQVKLLEEKHTKPRVVYLV
ncbi:MAG: 4Fe-4S dicluster domain-containing protein [Verrucomicrobiae bacterium]|nr:4Fe-4S dicluster domain-containing protein [Verrucomicrobiae bacterium]MDW8344437.1 4Fe-4S dicluster domain-containing protein [Verrucomicrobiae bacterium]